MQLIAAMPAMAGEYYQTIFKGMVPGRWLYRG